MGFNVVMDFEWYGVFEKYGVEMIGVWVDVIVKVEEWE